MTKIITQIVADVILALAYVGVFVVISLLLAVPIAWAWNYSVSHIFGLPAITWQQAWCLGFLCNVCLKPSASKKND